MIKRLVTMRTFHATFQIFQKSSNTQALEDLEHTRVHTPQIDFMKTHTHTHTVDRTGSLAQRSNIVFVHGKAMKGGFGQRISYLHIASARSENLS